MKLEFFDFIIVVMYFVICLVIGLYKFSKVNTPKKFAIGYESLSSSMLTCVIFGSVIGAGAMFGNMERLYLLGTVFLISQLVSPLYWVMTAKIYGSNIDRFLGCMSISHIMEMLYGSAGRWVSALVSVINSIWAVAAQALAIGYIFHYFLGLDVWQGIIISYGILTLYSSLGGIRAIIITELFQFFILFFIIPVSCIITLSYTVGGVGSLLNTLPISQWSASIDFENSLLLVSLIFFTVAPISDARLIQRYLMSSGAKQLEGCLKTVGMLAIPFTLSICIIAYVIKVNFPDVRANEGFLLYINNLPLGIKGLMIAGVIGAIMGVAESWLNATSVILVHDIFKRSYPNMRAKTELLMMRLFIIIISIISIAVALFTENVIQLIWLIRNFWEPPIMIPLIAGFMGFKASQKAFISSVTITIIFMIMAWLLTCEIGQITWLSGVIGSAIGLFGSHYICFSTRDRNMVTKRQFCMSSKEAIKNIAIDVQRLYYNVSKELKKNVLEDKKVNYKQFCMFTLAYYLSYLFHVSTGFITLASLLSAGYFFCFILIFRDIIFTNKCQEKYLRIYWYFTATFCLPFISTYMLLISRGDDFWVISSLLSCFSLLFFVNAMTFIIMITIGFISGYSFFVLSGNEFDIQTIYSIGYSWYIYLFLLLGSLIFFRNKEKKEKEKVETAKMFGGSVAHEVRSPIAAMVMSMENIHCILSDAIQRVDIKDDNTYIIEFNKNEYEFLQKTSKSLTKTGFKAINTVNSILTLLKSSIAETDKNDCNVNDVLKAAVKEHCKFSEQLIETIEIKVNESLTVDCPPNYLHHIFLNLLKNAYKHGGSNVKVKIWSSSNKLYFEDNGLGIPKDKLPYIFDNFYTGSKTGTGIGLSFCKVVLSDLGGSIECESVQGKYARFILTLPNALS